MLKSEDFHDKKGERGDLGRNFTSLRRPVVVVLITAVSAAQHAKDAQRDWLGLLGLKEGLGKNPRIWGNWEG